MSECDACGAEVNEDVERFARRMLASLETERATKLSAAYNGTPPSCLCAQCCNATVSMLNAPGRIE